MGQSLMNTKGIFHELQRHRLISQHMIVCQCVHDQGECYRLLTEEADECCISCATQQRQSQYHNALKGIATLAFDTGFESNFTTRSKIQRGTHGN
jgi:hypothetical protein